MLRVAIVGCGQVADIHVIEARATGLAEVVAVCDRHMILAQQMATRFSIPAHYADVDQMLERERPDVLHVTTPPASHVPLCLKAIGAGCHVYVEKPVAPTASETEMLVREARKASVSLTVGYSYYFDEVAVKLRGIVREGLLGEVVHAESFFGYSLQGPYGSAIMKSRGHWVHSLPGRLFHNNINHAINKVTEFISEEPVRITALAFRARDGADFGDERDGTLDELRVMVRGGRQTAYVTFSSKVKPVPHFLRLYGTKGCATADFTARSLVTEPEVRFPTVIGFLPLPFQTARRHLRNGFHNLRTFARCEFGYMRGMRLLLRLFYESVRSGTAPPIPYEIIVRDAIWMEQIFSQVYPGEELGA